MKVKCTNCGKVLDTAKDTIIYIDTEPYCDECATYCDICGYGCLRDETNYVECTGQTVCNDCLDEHFIVCNDCNKIVEKDTSYHVNGGDYDVCESCFNVYYASCEDCGWTGHIDYMFYDDDGYAYCEDCYHHRTEDEERLFDYHSDEGRENISHGYRYRVGIELEREDGDFLNGIDKYNFLDETGWVLEHDGSLSDAIGFEAISPTYPLKITELEKLFSKGILKKLARTSYSRRCGGHVTISDTKRTPCEIIDDIGGYLPILYAMFSLRTNNDYCFVESKDSYKSGGRRALHVKGEYEGGPLEIRIFDAPKDEKDLLNRLRFVKFMLSHKAETVEKAFELLSNNKTFRKIIKYHLKTQGLQLIGFYENIVGYARTVDRIIIKGGDMQKVVKVLGEQTN